LAIQSSKNKSWGFRFRNRWRSGFRPTQWAQAARRGDLPGIRRHLQCPLFVPHVQDCRDLIEIALGQR
jgi:hypothetical protein